MWPFSSRQAAIGVCLEQAVAFPCARQHNLLSFLRAGVPSPGSPLLCPTAGKVGSDHTCVCEQDVCVFLSLSPSSCSVLLPLFTFFFRLLPSVLLTSGYFGG